MKKLFIVLLFGCLFQPASAQSGFFNIGYNFGQYRMDSLNYVVDRYNETRDFLDKKMEHFKRLDGFAWGFGFSGDRTYFEGSLASRGYVASAEGIDNSNRNVRRELRFRATTWSVGLGYNVKKLVAVGASFDLVFSGSKTRYGAAESIEEEDFERIDSDINVGTTLFVNMFLPLSDVFAIQIKPYYQAVAFKQDMRPINMEINPGTYSNDPDEIRTNLHNFGIELKLAIGSEFKD